VRGIFTLRPTELDWFYEGGAAALFPTCGRASWSRCRRRSVAT
jgi:hypothetical protein